MMKLKAGCGLVRDAGHHRAERVTSETRSWSAEAMASSSITAAGRFSTLAPRDQPPPEQNRDIASSRGAGGTEVVRIERRASCPWRGQQTMGGAIACTTIESGGGAGRGLSSRLSAKGSRRRPRVNIRSKRSCGCTSPRRAAVAATYPRRELEVAKSPLPAATSRKEDRRARSRPQKALELLGSRICSTNRSRRRPRSRHEDAG
jgi:hypothetical protein